MSKYILYGIDEYESGETDYGTEIGECKVGLALFDDFEDAEDYIENSKTAEYQDYPTGRETYPQFKSNSLLYGYLRAEIEEKETLPHNPVLE